jgi:hypothetical protein
MMHGLIEILAVSHRRSFRVLLSDGCASAGIPQWSTKVMRVKARSVGNFLIHLM